ncbi:phage DNA replication protein RepA [Wolbachia endosymbiont of Armadillidium vulgare str. wVulC]|uniref:AAA family ATPase n=1 Tax=Wolbachia endosymbiont of Armadillidium vulgare TaxID=77039 RepID=UPI000649CBE1|nr:AAA family ATPase [Wolbachia endosymbiont of Armadillidium vulgare]KLT21864.1 phage replication protein RepA protein [Wolbachia endosymbiont of Armadillidium vulgare str. wVulC]KLT22789.1 phage DNA replication protein RepA [Wolbachia endosymbiont of Armadillidium vulgare str. wVulC]
MNFGLNSERLKAELLLQIRSCLSYLLPNGTFCRNEFQVGDIWGNRGKSLRVELSGSKAGLWNDFATGDGGDIIDLWAAVHRKNAKTEFSEVMASISEWLGKQHTREKKSIKDLEQYMTCSWNYYDENNQVIVIVYRYDPPEGKKEYRPFDVKELRFKEPDVRPLYNIPGILKSDKVVLVEGEKCAEALIEQGITATTAMFGSNASPDKTDWTPLKGKHIVIWPDNDEAGKRYAENAAKKLSDLGVASLVTLKIPQNKPKGWDAADCVQEGINVKEFLASTPLLTIDTPATDTSNMKSLERSTKQPLNILDWSAERFAGPVPEQKFLVEGLFPLGVTSIIAAMGDTGKGMLLLDLALKVASDKDQMCGFGSLVTEHGSVVIFSAEDDAGEVHRRLERLDPKCERLKYKDKLFIVPLPNVRGSLTILRNVRGKIVEVSPEFESIMKQLEEIKDLKLIVFDPLASFIHADINADPAVGDYLMCLLSDLACSTGASIITAHHMRKPKGEKPILTAEQARDAIRGTSALVNGVRCSYAFWPIENTARLEIFKAVGETPRQNALFHGAVVKANGLADRTVRTYLRNQETGLLEDITIQLTVKNASEKDLKICLIDAVTRSAASGHPFTHTGSTGVYKQRHRLPEVFHSMGRDRLERMVQELLQVKQLVKVMSTGSREDKWLDIPTGPFACGIGKFTLGAEDFSYRENLMLG